MNSPIKTLSALIIGGFLACTAVAGPGDAHPPFAYQPVKKTETVQIALFRAKAHVTEGKSVTTSSSRNIVSTPNVNPKIAGGSPTAAGYRY